MNKRQNIIIGIVVIAAIVAIIFGLNFLRGKKLFDDNQVLYAQYDRIDGLQKSSYVRLKGFNVGKVQDIYFSDEFGSKLIVSFTVDKRYRIPKNSQAQIVTTDLMGSRTINIVIPPNNDSITIYAQSGDTINGSIEGGLKQQVSEQVMPLKVKAESLLGSIDTMVNMISLIFNKDNREQLTKSFESIKRSMDNLESATGKVDRLLTTQESKLKNILSSSESVTSTLKQNENNINKILSNLSDVTDSLSKAEFASTLVRAQKALKQITITLEKINNEEGSFGALIHDKDLYNHLEDAAMNLERLLFDIKNNPKKYVNFSLIDFGKTVHYDANGNKISKRKLKQNKIYKIQILYSSRSISLDNEVFKGRKDIEELKLGKDKYKYTIGNSDNYKKISKLLKKIKRDFPDAFIIEFESKK